MNTITRFLAYLTVSLLITVGIPTAWGIDISATIWLDRYTILADGVTLQHDTGHLLKTGKFQVVTTEIVDPFWVDLGGIDTFVPMSGMLLMDATMFDGYKAERLINWNRSKDVYDIGYESFVVVTPKGFKPVTIKALTNKQSIIPVKLGRAVTLTISVQGSAPLTYQWYFNSAPYPDGPYNEVLFDQWMNKFAPIAKATKNSYKISKAKAGDIGVYYCVVGNGLSSATSDDFWLYLP